MLLPIGLSFHTFQAMSYTIEVYRGNQKAEKHFGIYSLYVMFYPQLVAGPIERPQNMLHQFYEKHQFNYEDMTAGIRQMAWGLFKKAVIADRLSIVVNTVYADPGSHNSLELLLAVLFFAFQIYCDFSGYSDIALGTARTMGFKLMTNFNNPFVSTKVTEFWRRWHISLSTWFNDYLFSPIVIARRDWGKAGVAFAVFITFFISGLWHGAGWSFIFWGVLNGAGLIYEFLTSKFRKSLAKRVPRNFYRSLSMGLTFSFMCFTWIFFRSPTLHVSGLVIKGIASGILAIFQGTAAHQWKLGFIGMNLSTLMLSFLLIIGLMVIERFQERFNLLHKFLNARAYIRWPVYLGFIYVIMAFGVFEKSQFIYFQF
ncbi:MBOAT family O-acyltransferase [Mucilaginibacter sp. HD30]